MCRRGGPRPGGRCHRGSAGSHTPAAARRDRSRPPARRDLCCRLARYHIIARRPRTPNMVRNDEGMALSELSGSQRGFCGLWQRPRYPSFVLTVSLSRTSSVMFNTAGVLLILQRTGSAPLAGLTAAAAVVPGALARPVLGAWLDVAHRRRVLIVVDQ